MLSHSWCRYRTLPSSWLTGKLALPTLDNNSLERDQLKAGKDAEFSFESFALVDGYEGRT